MRVRNIGIIEDISWQPGDSLNVVTGETGAGKSLVIGALEALLGGKTDASTVHHGAPAGLIEGTFTLNQGGNSQALELLLSKSGIPFDDNTLIISCEINPNGRALYRINGRATPKNILKQVAGCLIDIHGQSEQLSLLDPKRQMDFLDSFAGTDELCSEYHQTFRELQNLEQELNQHNQNEGMLADREELLQFQVEEINTANLSEGEDILLEREKARLLSFERLKTTTRDIITALSGSETADEQTGALEGLQTATNLLGRLIEIDASLADEHTAMENASYSLAETARAVNNYYHRLEYDEAQLEEIETRLILLSELKRKYDGSISTVIAHGQKAAETLESITHGTAIKLALSANINAQKEQLGQKAWALSEARHQAAGALSEAVASELADLGMGQMSFFCRCHRVEATEGLAAPDGNHYVFTGDGIDRVEFAVVTNTGEPAKALNRIASTGETSRFMLALKTALARADITPMLVFDEIDIGVGGRSGGVIGQKLATLGLTHQVVCITHLPQIAAFAESHYHISKQTTGGKTSSSLTTLEGEDRINELAAMLSGQHYTQTALSAATELVQAAGAWKQASTT
ncbi:DNA repair protein RecN [Chloroflexota bacterium]